MSIFLAMALAVAGSLIAAIACAQGYPNKPVQLVVPFAPTGSTSLVFRAMAPVLAEKLGQQLVILNRPGGAATIGMAVVAKSAPDGYTLGVATLSFAANPPFMVGQMPFDTEKDFAAVSLVTRLPMVLTINPGVPARSVKELIALAKVKPGALNYGSAGIASSGHLGGALFEMMAGIQMTHIPFSSTGSATGVVAGQTQLQIAPIPSSLSFIQSGKMIALGVSSLKPVSTLPGVPAIAETGIPGFEAYEWSGIVAPVGTLAAIIARLQKDIAATLADAEVGKRIEGIGAQTVGSTADEFDRFLKKELGVWAKVAAAIQAASKANQ
ncbi:MAG: Bug family tripartite tricarboxylate transporter substrate binding protein [Burkholderiales bacterium]